MSELTPAKIMDTFRIISRSIDDETEKLADLDRAETRARHAWRRNYNQTFLMNTHDINGKQISIEQRKAMAEESAADLELMYDLAGVELRKVKDQLKMLRDRLEIGRSTSAVMRMEWTGGQNG